MTLHQVHGASVVLWRVLRIGTGTQLCRAMPFHAERANGDRPLSFMAQGANQAIENAVDLAAGPA
ncbi:hypothetical protein ACWGBH_06145 [Streptomyces massasporeus]